MEPDAFRLLLLLLLLCWLVVGPVPAQLRHPLPVLLLMPAGENLTTTAAAGVGPAVRLALEDLKKQPPPLGNYELQLQLLDSQCDPATSLKALFDALWAGPKYLLLLGGVCPAVTSLVARSLPALHLVQVSFAATPPSLSNRKWYGHLFSSAPSDRALNQAAVKLLQRHKWARVGVITQDTPRGSQVRRDLLRQLLKVDVQVVSSESLSDDVCSSMRRMKDQDVRIFIIIITESDQESEAEVYCCAYRLNLFGAGYQWLVVDGGAAGWRPGGRSSGCSAADLLTAADGSIRLQSRVLSRTDAPATSGRTPQDYQDSYLRQLDQDLDGSGSWSGSSSGSGPLHAFAYDAVWIGATALSQVTEAVKQREKFSRRRNETVSEEEAERLLLEAVRSTQLQGVTGPVSFRNGERMTVIELIQFQGSSGVLVGEFSTTTLQLRLPSHLIRFKGPGPTRDRTQVRVQHRGVNVHLYVAASSAAAVTIVFTLVILCFVLTHHHSGGGSSQDELLLLGLLLSSSWVLVSGLDGASVSDSTFDLLCSVRLWTLSVGHAVGFTALFTRCWRIYSLCSVTHQRVQGGGRVGLCLLLLEVFVLTTWQIMDPLRRVVLQHRPQTDPSDPNTVVQMFSESCSCSNMELWLTAVFGYKGPLLGLVCFLAWSSRCSQVQQRPAVSSKHLSVSVFAVTAFSVSGASGSLLTSHNPPLQFCLSSVFILSCNIWILGFLLVPTISYARLSSSELRKSSELQGEAVEEEEEEEDQLSRLNQQLKSRTAQLDVELHSIRLLLAETLHHVNDGEVRCVTHEAQVCAEVRHSDSPDDDINSPELVRRRLSVQLPILHHSYLPVIGGVSCSSSSLFGSREAFVHHDALFPR